MSYCRWSSMNWRCDVYVYEDVAGGWTTHVAGNRKIIRPVPDLLGCKLSMWLHRWSGVYWDRSAREVRYPSRWRKALYTPWSGFVCWWHDWVHLGTLRLIPRRPIGLPFDGETFGDETAAECADRLVWLRSLGYVVPQSAIDALRAESTA